MSTFNLSGTKTWSGERPVQGPPSETIHTICLKNGLLTSLLFLGCFIATISSWETFEISWLSVFNILFLFLGVFFALENASPTGKGGSLDYFDGLKIGLYTSVLAVGVYALLVGIYTAWDRSLLERIQEGFIFKMEMDPFTVTGTLFFEGIASGLIITYSLMQYFKQV